MQRILSEGFRAFFLSAGLYAVFAGLIWVIWLGVHAAGGMMGEMPFAVPPFEWHAHEMIFGYAAAAVGGFFLTAVPNWTGARDARMLFVTGAVGLWLIGRLAVWYSAALPAGAVAVADLAFVPVLAAKIASQLIRRPKPQNMIFLGVLCLYWVANLMVHLDWMGLAADSAATGLRAGLLVLCALIAVLGGRITPAFTRNAMKRAGVDEARWPVSAAPVERASAVLMLGLPVLVMAGAPVPLAAGVALAAGLVQALRLARWRGRWTLSQPILLALHLGLAMLAAGLVLWGLAGFGIGSEVAALHILGIGTVGGMTLAVMSRAILGHTGRALVAPRPVALGYGAVALAAVLRWLSSTLGGAWYFPAALGAGVLWVLAFTLFLAALWPALSGPKLGKSPDAA